MYKRNYDDAKRVKGAVKKFMNFTNVGHNKIKHDQVQDKHLVAYYCHLLNRGLKLNTVSRMHSDVKKGFELNFWVRVNKFSKILPLIKKRALIDDFKNAKEIKPVIKELKSIGIKSITINI